MKTIRETPYRTPMAVSDAIKNLIDGKIVCDLGCAEGDNLMFMERYASQVLGVEQDQKRYKHAQERGYDVTIGNYLECSLPEADVYYIWPNDGPKDNETLVKRLIEIKHKCTVVIAGDTGFAYEMPAIHYIAEKYDGKLIDVPYNEGTKNRQFGTFILCVLEIQ